MSAGPLENRANKLAGIVFVLDEESTKLAERRIPFARLAPDLGRFGLGQVDVGRTHGTDGQGHVNLDGFKRINDVHGHAAGDRAIVDFGSLLLRVFRASDIIGRLGGDEFVVLAFDTADVTATLARVRSGLNEYNLQGERPFQLRSASFVAAPL